MAGPSPSTQTVDALRALRARFRATSANTVDAFRQLARQLAAAPDAPEVVEALRRELHRVHGTAGSYGFMDASRLAGKIEQRVQRWATDSVHEHAQRATIVEHFATALALAFEYEDQAAAADVARPLIAFVGVSAEDQAALRSEAALRGWRSLVVADDVVLEQALVAAAPAVVVSSAAGSGHIVRAAAEAKAAAIVLVRSGSGERSELSAPAQSDRVLVLDPAVGASAIIDGAESLTPRARPLRATVLIVDDDPSILATARYILETDDIHVITADDPALVVGLALSSLPSLVLMKIATRDSACVEVVRTLRAAPATRDLPVILWASDLDAATREAAHAAGADELIARPPVERELRRRVSERIERLRESRSANGLHPLTSLPLSARTGGEAAVAIAALAGNDRPLTVAMIRADGEQHSGEGFDWLRESRRIADSIGAAFAGYTDGSALLLVAASDASVLAARLGAAAAARPANAQRWRAGVAAAIVVGARDFETLRQAADDALDLGADSGSPVQIWSRESANLAPDVIVIEDDRALADMLQFALRSTGLTHRVFDNGRAALDAILAMNTLGRRPLLLLDVDLPGIDGYTLHERLRVERPGAFQVVFITVHAAEAEQIRALRAGALDYILKPLNLRILMAKVPLWVERARRG
jgi:DNA-binding response OmpR family regulator/HPt (histidine-containing phosphotransfer) domain-containing protein